MGRKNKVNAEVETAELFAGNEVSEVAEITEATQVMREITEITEVEENSSESPDGTGKPIIKLSGRVYTWTVKNKSRKYANLNLTMGELSDYAKAFVYDSGSNKGEQRNITPSHAKEIARAYDEGEYTPTAFAVGLHPKHLKNLFEDGDRFELTHTIRTPEDKLPLLDGQHRLNAFEILVDKVKVSIEFERNRDEPDEETISLLEESLRSLREQPVPVLLYLDGKRTKTDFQNLQKGMPVPKNHRTIMEIRNKPKNQLTDKDIALSQAFNLARLLHTNEQSPLYGNIQLGSTKTKNMIPFTSLAVTNPTDSLTSLTGLVRIAMLFPAVKKDDADGYTVEFLAELVIHINNIIKERCKHLLADEENVLRLPKDGGTIFGAGMLLGITTLFAYRMGYEKFGEGEGFKTSSKDDDILIEAVESVFNITRDGDGSAQRKRVLMGEFAQVYFADFEESKVRGIPKGLVDKDAKVFTLRSFGLATE